VSTLPGLDDPQDDLSVSARSNAMLLFNPVFNNGPGQWGYSRVGDRYKEFSPAHNIGPGVPPAVVFLGDHDQHIPVQVLTDFKSAMEKAGARCDAHVYPGQKHGFFNYDPVKADDRYYYRATTREADRFLASLGWLQGPPTMPAATQPAR
jgi:acetyl esterase/lipase